MVPLQKAQSDKVPGASYPVMVYRVIAIFFVLAISLFLLLFQSPSLFDRSRRLLLMTLSIGHIPLFGVLSWMALLAINLRTLKVRDWPLWSYGAAFVLTMGVAVFSEAIQVVTPRDASVKDVLYNGIGVFLFLGAGLLWINRDFPELSGRWYKPSRVVFIFTTAVIAFLVVRPLVLLAVEEKDKKESFPVIASFETKRELRRWRKGSNEWLLSKEFVAEGKSSLRLTFHPAKYAGITMPYPPNDWTGYTDFHCTIFNPSAKRLDLTMKIFDREHNYQYSDRFNRILRISPGRNDISIPLMEVATAPKRRKMRMNKIAQLSFFIVGLKEKEVLYFDNIHLSSGGRE
jgi:hypothetical protein